MIMKAYDIVVGGDGATPPPGRPALLPAGWAGPQGPAIDPVTWPRSPRTGQPMHHRFTLWLPLEYRRRGEDLVAVSVFQWCDALYWRGPASPGTAVPAHPHLQLADDGVDQVFALLWLTEAEYSGPRTARPVPAAPPVDGEQDPDGVPPRYAPLGAVWLAERDDPQAGVAPADSDDDDDDDDDDERYETFGMEHLGGTVMSPNGPRDGLSPWYLEVNRLGGVNHGGDRDIAFDLASALMLGGMSSHIR
ncbi:hypothetical protein [Actinoplanes xinjiangensis]|uniref:Uncharacterized protein n=1 Tax=Actinoplanes xinjiangensis TaxID=512350 RepID=A0A316FLS6_9ACTN|nr:hypothetical protein [Actinoplanes xinjiangensis]PWK49479.1 hypothetical protein BC793_104152 [Actinoplanes xinjiangensis]GIF37484.1 hypothetical protein Axi01nite_17950 [Actinoplanes xinjiangensis]